MDPNNPYETWQAVIEKVKSYGTVNPAQVDAFLGRMQPQASSVGFLLATVDTDFIKGQIEKRFLSQIEQALRDLFETEYVVEIEVDPGLFGVHAANRHTKRPASDTLHAARATCSPSGGGSADGCRTHRARTFRTCSASRAADSIPAPGRTASSACCCGTTEHPAAAGGDKPPHRQPNRAGERHGHGRRRADLRELHHRRFEPFGLFDGRIGSGIARQVDPESPVHLRKKRFGQNALATSYPELHSGNAARYARGVYRRAGIHHGVLHRRD